MKTTKIPTINMYPNLTLNPTKKKTTSKKATNTKPKKSCMKTSLQECKMKIQSLMIKMLQKETMKRRRKSPHQEDRPELQHQEPFCNHQ